MASLCQVALVRLPIVQNTTAPSACSEATNCRSDRSALKVNTSAMPSSTTVSVVDAAPPAERVDQEGRAGGGDERVGGHQ